MGSYVGAIDQGTTSTRFIIFDRQGEIVSHRPEGARTDHAQAGMGRTRRRRNLAQHAGGHFGRAGEARPETRRSAQRRPHQPARNHIDLESPHRRAAAQCAGVDGHAHRRSRARIFKRRRPGSAAAKNRTAARHLFFRAQTALAARPCSRRAKRRRVGRCAVRHDGLMDRLEAYGGRRLHITDVTNASRTQLMNLETLDWDQDILNLFDIPRACLPEIRSSSEVFGDCDRRARRRPARRHSGRPARRSVRPGLPASRAGEEHLWHRLLHADEHRRKSRFHRHAG